MYASSHNYLDTYMFGYGLTHVGTLPEPMLTDCELDTQEY